MMRLIVCIDENGGIGKDGDLLFHIKEDMKRFRQLTENNVVIMGRKTLESLSHKKLPNRLNIVLTHQDIESNDPEVIYMNSIDEIISYIHENKNKKEIFCIGGASLYVRLFPYCRLLHITLVHTVVEDADTFFSGTQYVKEMIQMHNEDLKKDTIIHHDEKTGLDYEMMDIENTFVY